MKEEILNSIEKTYDSFKRKKMEYEQIKKRLLELENNKEVKEYLRLLSITKSIDLKREYYNDEEMLELAFRSNMNRIDETNNIYICIGNTMVKEKEYTRYKNLENSFDNVFIPKEELETFEKKHQIVYLKENTTEEYRKLQLDFIKTSISIGQQNACKKILTKKK